MANEPITREEILLNAVATGEQANIKPITREEMFLAKLSGADVQTPNPITRQEMFLQKIIDQSGGGTIPTEIKTEQEMNALLSTAQVGSIYKYVGETTSTYENGFLYVVEFVE